LDEQDRGSQPVLRSFLEAVGDRVTPATVSKPTLTELCHALEDLIVAEDLAGTVIAGFQHARFWAVERDRYEAMTADPRRRAVVFTAEGDDVATSVSHLAIGAEHPLAREWFVVALNEGFSAVLFGRELTRSGEAVNGRRLFLAVWSFDPQVVDQLLAVLGSALGDEVPGARSLLAAARAAHPPRHAAPGVGDHFTTAVVERLETAMQRALGAEAELVEARLPAAARERPEDTADPEAGAADHGQEGGQEAGHAAGGSAAATTSAATDTDAGGSSPAAPTPAPDQAGGAVAGHRGGGGRCALVLDEDAAMRGFLEALLRRAGWEVMAAASVAEAAEVLQRTRCDVLLIDLLLRGADETGLAELERTQPGLRHRTAFLADDPPLTGRVNGRPVLVKPVAWSELEAVLGTLTAAL
jgi:DICT domain-containing protein